MKQYNFHALATSVLVVVLLALHLSSAGEVTHETCVEAFKQAGEVRQCCSNEPLRFADQELKTCMGSRMQSGKGMKEALECCGQECFVRLGLLNHENELDQSKLHELAAALGGEWGDKNKEIIDKLLDHVRQIKEQHGSQHGECDFSAAFFIMTYGKEYIRQCLNWNDSDFCSIIRKCNEMKPPRQ